MQDVTERKKTFSEHMGVLFEYFEQTKYSEEYGVYEKNESYYSQKNDIIKKNYCKHLYNIPKEKDMLHAFDELTFNNFYGLSDDTNNTNETNNKNNTNQ